MAGFQDRILVCVDCSTEFVFTAGEQQFYHDKNFTNEPRRCKGCKAKRQASGDRGGRGHGAPQGRVETSATCSQCGRETTVPFRPTQGRPVLCRECFQSRKTAEGVR
jgi:CxxC-x17-CxxC domain-containing protein